MIAKAHLIVMVSHDLEALVRFCNRAIWLDAGLIKMDGDVDTVLDAYEALVER